MGDCCADIPMAGHCRGIPRAPKKLEGGERVKEVLWWFAMGVVLVGSILFLAEWGMDLSSVIPGGVLVACVFVMAKKAVKTFSGKRGTTEDQ